MKQTSIKPIFLDIIPDHIDEGILYICEQYKTAIHKCCCGCGEEVVTPLSPADWSVRRAGNVISLFPSIGNWSFACKSHYYIKKNRVIWAAKFQQWQIDQVRARDRADKKAYIEAINQHKNRKPKLFILISKLWRVFLRLFKS